jgi:serine/threonine protein kinase/sugar lactone lactonase YvrE
MGRGAAKPMDALRPGDPASVGGYRLLSRLGAGGMGEVFLGVSPGGRTVAVKLIHPAHAETAHFRDRFAREIEAARRVGGFHTALVVDADPNADPPWMVTAYIEGPSLQEAVGRYGPMPPDRVQALGAGLAEGLAAIHGCGLVHRDLKPGNVILAADGPRIIDFGIARAVDATTGLTTTGSVVGTIAYMSPEQIRGEPASTASDIFALGSVLAFAATGRPPFIADSAAATMFRIVNQPPDLDGVADPGLARQIIGCLAKSTAERPGVPAVLAAFTGRAQASAAPAPVAAMAASGVASAPRYGSPTRTDASAPPETGPAREAPPPRGVPSSPRALHARRSRRSRRWPAVIITAVVVAVALALTAPMLLAKHAPPTAQLSPAGPVPVRDLTLPAQVGAQFGGIMFSPNGRLLAAGSGGHAYVWNLVTGKRAATLNDPGSGTGQEAFSPDSKLLADGDSVLNRVYLWNAATGQRTATFAAPGSGGIDGLAFSSGSKLLAASDGNKHIYVWDLTTGGLTLTLTDTSIDGGVAFSPDGKLLVGGDITGGGNFFVWNAATGKRVATFHDPGGQGVNDVTFSPGGTLLAAADSNGKIYLWNAVTHAHVATLTAPGKHGSANWVTFSPDGTLLADADGNGHAYLWHTATHELAGTYTGTSEWQVWGVAFSPNGKLLAIADGDGSIYVKVTSRLIS